MEKEVDIRNYINDEDTTIKNLKDIITKKLDKYDNNFKIRLKLDRNINYKILLRRTYDLYSNINIIYPKNDYKIFINNLPNDLCKLINSYLNYEINAYMYSEITKRNFYKFENNEDFRKKKLKKLELKLNNLYYFNVNNKDTNFDKYIKNKIPIVAIQYDDIYINIKSTANTNILLNFSGSIVNDNINEYLRNAEYTYETNLDKHGIYEKKKIIIKGGLLYHDFQGCIL